MSAVRYLVPALAAVSGAFAQSSSCSGTTTIQNAGDATGLAGCKTYSGTIAIATGTTDDIALNGIQKIAGNLTALNVTGMSSLSADSLESITGKFWLESLTVLTNLNFPALTDVKTIQWKVLNQLQSLAFSDEGVQMANAVDIEDTYLNTLDGINLQTVDTMIIANNRYLSEINMQLANVSSILSLESNGGNLTATFPNLVTANNLTFRNVSQISLPSLANLTSGLGFYSNEITSLSAPNLTQVGGLSFVSNTDLKNISFPMLKTVKGGLQVANNTLLDDISFPKLVTITGALDFNGNFSSVEVPSLKSVQGAANVQSSEVIDDTCDDFKKLKSDGVIEGNNRCEGQLAKPAGAGQEQSGAKNSDAAGGSGTSTNAASGHYAQSAAITGVLGVFAAMLGML